MKNPGTRLGIAARWMSVGVTTALLALVALPGPASAEPPSSKYAMAAPYESAWSEGTASADPSSGRLAAVAVSASGTERRSIAGVAASHPVPSAALRITYVAEVVVDDARAVAGPSSGPNDASRAATFLFAQAVHSSCGGCQGSAIRYLENANANPNGQAFLSFVVENADGGRIPTGDIVVKVHAQAEATSGAAAACQAGSACSPMGAQATLHAVVREITASIAYTSAEFPDLAIESLTATQTDPSAGEAPLSEYLVTYSATVVNHGATDAPAFWTLFRTYCGEFVCRFHYRLVNPIRAGESRTASVAATALFQLKPGTYQVEAIADAYGAVPETDETNNADLILFRVSAARAADLVVDRIVIDPAAPEAGQTVAISATIRNAGSRAAGGSAVRFAIDGDTSGPRLAFVPPLLPGASSTATTQWTALAGVHVVDVDADALGNVPEADETNNRGAKQLQVRQANRAPVARADAFTAAPGQTLRVASPGILANDEDADGDRIRSVLSSGAGSGTLQLNSDGSLTYTSNAGFVGKDSFTYRAWDGRAYGNRATVTFEVG